MYQDNEPMPQLEGENANSNLTQTSIQERSSRFIDNQSDPQIPNIGHNSSHIQS